MGESVTMILCQHNSLAMIVGAALGGSDEKDAVPDLQNAPTFEAALAQMNAALRMT